MRYEHYRVVESSAIKHLETCKQSLYENCKNISDLEAYSNDAAIMILATKKELDEAEGKVDRETHVQMRHALYVLQIGGLMVQKWSAEKAIEWEDLE